MNTARPTLGHSQPVIRPGLHRSLGRAWLGGVAGGIARHLGWSAWVVRGGFIALTFCNLFTVGIYAALWMLMADEPSAVQAPGIMAASHQGMRPAGNDHSVKGSGIGRITAFSMLAVGVLALASRVGWGISSPLFWPALMAAIGIVLVWLQADTPATGRNRWLLVLRVIVGMSMLGVGISLLTAAQIGLDQIPVVMSVVALSISGLLVVAAPWFFSYLRKLDIAREEKLIADTRADMAAHLHDSVLQTLALIQRQADDPRQVASLARRQERELRTWLYGDVKAPGTLKAALVEAGGEIEDERGVPIEVICVGDVELDERLHVLVQSAREAMMNAAKHSKAAMIDVYAEVDRDADPATAQVFVRDRGVGFDMARIAADRMGVRGSIIDRMERHGGVATIRTAPGEGTEIRLEMKL
ncbi:hypothetical protein HMPREF1531_01679 [Propionibacterium sp. oral taxon 192 str. F0372]|uniref:ATP-binding protein n=1 Tax=Propionibacterium sp. oral taxon 192 TaxID=671222 RepID=UPI00035478C0|nr:ATP-binding protein [Propionibacterium sp. oral taxon 192]EPH02373.1 hypothetical protein HMPREF1531_01679 [Propionibacterium sp. oral taxon 192 str. F0372]